MSGNLDEAGHHRTFRYEQGRFQTQSVLVALPEPTQSNYGSWVADFPRVQTENLEIVFDEKRASGNPTFQIGDIARTFHSMDISSKILSVRAFRLRFDNYDRVGNHWTPAPMCRCVVPKKSEK